MAYRPKLVKQGDGTSCQWSNCVAAATATALRRHTRGQKRIRPSRIRSYFGYYCPGIPYDTAVAAVRYFKGETLKPLYWIKKEEFKDIIKDGRGAVLHISYAAVQGTQFQASAGFYGLHAIYVNEKRWNKKLKRNEYLVYDPLADGRYPWIPQGPQWWPAKLVYKAAEWTGGYIIVYTRDTEG